MIRHKHRSGVCDSISSYSAEYDTEELSEFLWQLVTVTTSPQQFRDIDARKMNIVITQLRAGDKLCEAAKKEIAMDRSIFERLFGGPVADSAPTIRDLKKAIADYEGLDEDRKS